MTVFTDPLGKERQGYIDEKVYGIPRRQVDFPSEFIPRPEVYVEPPVPMAEHTRTPLVATDQPPMPTENDHEEYHGEEDHEEYLPEPTDEYVDQEPSGYHPPHEHNKRYDDYGNGYIDYEHKSLSGSQRWDRDYYRDSGRDRPRDHYDSRHYHRDSRGRHMNHRDRDMYERGVPTDRHDRRFRDRYDDGDYRTRDRDNRYSRGHTSSRHDRDTERYSPPRPSHLDREYDYDRRSHIEYGRSLSERATREPVPPVHDHVSSVLDGPPRILQHPLHESLPPGHIAGVEEPAESDSQEEVSQGEEEQAPEAAPTPATLDLDSRIQMMLNQNKDLAGFGAPEPVTATPTEPAPPPVIMPLEPQVPPPVGYGGMHPTPPIDPGYAGSKYIIYDWTLNSDICALFSLSLNSYFLMSICLLHNVELS